MRQLCVCQQFNQNFLKSPPSPVKGAPGPLAAFLRLFPLLVGLHSRLHLFRAKDPLDPCIVGREQKNPQVPFPKNLRVKLFIPTRRVKSISKLFCIEDLIRRDFI